MKIFRRVSSIGRLLTFSTERFFRATVESSEATVAAPLGPLLGQLQVPLIEFCNSFNEQSSQTYVESVDLRVQLTKRDTKYAYNIFFPPISFFCKQFYWGYGLDLESSIYDYYLICLEDLWFIVVSFSKLMNFSHGNTSKFIFGYLYSSIVSEILILILFHR